MTVGIDFDNTLVNTYEVSKKYLDEFLPGNNYKSYHELDLQTELDFFDKYHLKITESLNLYDGVKEAFEYFKENNIKIVLITARGYDRKDLIAPTKAFLEKEGLEFDKMCFSKPVKGACCKENRVDLFIDDSLNVVPEVYNSGTKVLLFGKESPIYDYVLNWHEVIEYIKKGIK